MGCWSLTEFFVRPDQQAHGVDRTLLERVFRPGRASVRSIIATMDVRAQARYYAAGNVARFPLYTLSGPPGEGGPAGELHAEPVDGEGAIEAQRAIERSVLGHRRTEEEIRWLLERRRGHLYRRHGRPVGFSFLGQDGAGPMAALEPSDLPVMLLHAGGVARGLGLQKLKLQVPAPNAVAIRHLTRRRFPIRSMDQPAHVRPALDGHRRQQRIGHEVLLGHNPA